MANYGSYLKMQVRVITQKRSATEQNGFFCFHTFLDNIINNVFNGN